MESDPDAALAALDEAFVDARLAVDELRELASGIHPAVLTQRGLDAALESLATRAAVPVEYQARWTSDSPTAVESAAYFVVAEALANVAKHAGASFARVEVRREGEQLVLVVSDDGAGGADADGRQRPARPRGPARRARRPARGRQPARRRHAPHRAGPAAVRRAGR